VSTIVCVPTDNTIELGNTLVLPVIAVPAIIVSSNTTLQSCETVVCGDTDNRRKDGLKMRGKGTQGGKRNIGKTAETTPQYWGTLYVRTQTIEGRRG